MTHKPLWNPKPPTLTSILCRTHKSLPYRTYSQTPALPANPCLTYELLPCLLIPNPMLYPPTPAVPHRLISGTNTAQIESKMDMLVGVPAAVDDALASLIVDHGDNDIVLRAMQTYVKVRMCSGRWPGLTHCRPWRQRHCAAGYADVCEGEVHCTGWLTLLWQEANRRVDVMHESSPFAWTPSHRSPGEHTLHAPR